MSSTTYKPGAQYYMEAGGFGKKTAEAAGAVLDRIRNGEVSWKDLSNTDIAKLKLTTSQGAKAISLSLGVPIQKSLSTADARSALRTALIRLNTKQSKFQRENKKDFSQEIKASAVEKGEKYSIINERKMAMGMRRSPFYILTQKEINSIIADAEAMGIDLSILSFNTGSQTGFVDYKVTINIRGDILPDMSSSLTRDRMSQRAVLAHEYFGHYLNHPSEYEIGDWRDEFRASYDAAVKAPNLSREDRAYLMIDAYDRAREAGEMVEYDDVARRIIYGY